MGKAVGGVIIGEDEIQYGKVWRDGEQKIFEWHNLNLKNMNALPKSGDKIRFSGKYLDLDEKGCAVPTVPAQQVGHASRDSTAQYNWTNFLQDFWKKFTIPN